MNSFGIARVRLRSPADELAEFIYGLPGGFPRVAALSRRGRHHRLYPLRSQRRASDLPCAGAGPQHGLRSDSDFVGKAATVFGGPEWCSLEEDRG